MPNGEAHEALIRQAYSAIGLDMAGTAMVEAHGKSDFLGMTRYFSSKMENNIDPASFQAPEPKLEILSK